MIPAFTLTLIAITDDLRDGQEGLVARAAAAVRGGATLVQVRLKQVDARTLVDVTRALVTALPVPVMVNDRVDVALAAGAAGAHLGFDDLPIAAARRIVPTGFVLGASLGDAAEAPNARAADFAGVGPVFGTDSKQDAGPAIGVSGLSRLAEAGRVPVVGIGGVSAENAGSIVRAGAVGVAAIRAIFGAADPERAARALRTAVDDALAARAREGMA